MPLYVWGPEGTFPQGLFVLPSFFLQSYATERSMDKWVKWHGRNSLCCVISKKFVSATSVFLSWLAQAALGVGMVEQVVRGSNLSPRGWVSFPKQVLPSHELSGRAFCKNSLKSFGLIFVKPH